LPVEKLLATWGGKRSTGKVRGRHKTKKNQKKKKLVVLFWGG